MTSWLSQPVERDPVVILGVPRSGTSMIAGIFAKHGLWCGTYRDPDSFNARGHFENLPVKHLMKRRLYGNRCTNEGVLAEPWPSFKIDVSRAIKEDGYMEGPWMFKCAPVYWPLFHSAWRPTWVTVRRPRQAIVESNESTGFVPTIRCVIDFHLEQMEHVESELGAVAVDADSVVRGELGTLRAALDSAGVDMNEEIVESFVDPGLWRHNG